MILHYVQSTNINIPLLVISFNQFKHEILFRVKSDLLAKEDTSSAVAIFIVNIRAGFLQNLNPIGLHI